MPSNFFPFFFFFNNISDKIVFPVMVDGFHASHLPLWYITVNSKKWNSLSFNYLQVWNLKFSLFQFLIVKQAILFRSVQSLSHVRLFAIQWTAARQASLSITNSLSLLKLMSIESVMPSNHLILCCPLFSPAFNLAQHQGLFKWVSCLYQVAKVLEFQLQHQSFQWTFRTGFL